MRFCQPIKQKPLTPKTAGRPSPRLPQADSLKFKREFDLSPAPTNSEEDGVTAESPSSSPHPPRNGIDDWPTSYIQISPQPIGWLTSRGFRTRPSISRAVKFRICRRERYQGYGFCSSRSMPISFRGGFGIRHSERYKD